MTSTPSPRLNQLLSPVRIMRPTLAFLQTQYLLSAFFGVCMPGVVASLPQALPWHVSCPSRCVCQIKPWFSPDSVYHEAPTVDCNNLLLMKLPSFIPTNTHTLRLQSNLLSELDTAVLRGLPNLTDLDLSQNRFSRVRAITQSSPQPTLLSLHLEENQINCLPEASFSSLPTLQELFLSHNDLQSIAPGAFIGLDSVMRLHINNNRLTNIDPQWFRNLPHLEVLMLGGNPVEALPELGFQALKSLRSLVLGGMGLRHLAEKSLEGLESLESLSFYDNLLIRVPTQALKRVPGLKFLDLNKNRIKLIETGDFRDMIHLKELGLNNMEELVSIEKAALENLPELTKLEITNNPRLSYIHPKAFVQLTRLESLMLNSNSLSALHQRTMLSLPSLREVSLHSNPLRCDCLFHWAAEEASHPHAVDAPTDTQTLRMVRFIQPQATLCSEPPELRARRVREVSSGEMSASCLPMIPTGSLPSYVGVREGGKLVLHCRALADPQPKLYWVTPSGVRLGPAQNHVSRDVSAPGPCHPLISSKDLNQTSTSSFWPSQTPDVPTCNLSKHYRLLPEGTLELNKVTPKEAGLYTCVAENALGADTRSVMVSVHGRDKKRRKGLAANIKRYPLIREEIKFEVREVGQHYSILSWQTGHNLQSTRLSWQVINSNSHKPTYTTRILAGTQSFNLTQLQPETFYRVCLHMWLREGAKHTSSRSRGSRETHCVSFMTENVPEARPSLQLNPELTSTAITLLLLALIMLLLAAQGWKTDPSEEARKQHNTPTKEITHPAALIISHKIENQLQIKKSDKLLFHQDC